MISSLPAELRAGRHYPTLADIALLAPPLRRTTGGNLYDRRLVRFLKERGLDVAVPDAAGEWPPARVLIQDELLHRTFLPRNRAIRGRPAGDRPRPRIVALVHHLASLEPERDRRRRRALARSERGYLGTVDAIAGPSRATVESALRLSGLPGAAAVVAPPGRDRLGDVPIPGPGEIAARAREAGPLRVAFVGSLAPRKRVLELLRAVAGVPACRIEVAGGNGTGPGAAAYAARVRRFASEPGSRVEFVGELDTAALADLLRRSHLLAMPSTHEGFGMAYLEGFAFGLPAIAAASGGAPELVEDGRTGFLIANRRPAAATRRIAGILRDLAEDRARLAELGVAAAARWRRWPRWSESLTPIEALCRRLLRDPENAGAGDPGR